MARMNTPNSTAERTSAASEIAAVSTACSIAGEGSAVIGPRPLRGSASTTPLVMGDGAPASRRRADHALDQIIHALELDRRLEVALAGRHHVLAFVVLERPLDDGVS